MYNNTQSTLELRRFCTQCGAQNIGPHHHCLICHESFRAAAASFDPPIQDLTGPRRWYQISAVLIACVVGGVLGLRFIGLLTGFIEFDGSGWQWFLKLQSTAFSAAVFLFIGWSISRSRQSLYQIAWRLGWVAMSLGLAVANS